jgi:hypothetical protein
MGIFTIIFALLVAFVFAGIFSFLLNYRGPWGKFWAFFLIIFLGVWAASLWVYPVGPLWYDVAWIPLLFVGLLIALLLSAATFPTTARKIKETDYKSEENELLVSSVGIFFWLIAAVFTIAIIIGIML